MTLDDAKKLADRGNVDAMMALANYYSKQESDEDAIDIAFHYYELAAEAGEPNAILKMAQSTSMTAKIAFTMIETAGRIESMDSDIEKAYYWASKLESAIRKLNITDNDTIEFVQDNMLLALSRLATLYYCDKKYDDVVRITKSINHPYAQAVFGLASYQLAESDEEMNKAFLALNNIENKSCWKQDYQTKFGQILLLEATTYLSALYRIVNHDVDSAYRVLSRAAEYTADESIRQDILYDMKRHFKKKMFGGLAYVE